MTTEQWSEDSWCVVEYREVTGDKKNRYLTGLILTAEDLDNEWIEEQVTQFIDMAAQAGSAIIVVETCWIMNMATDSPEKTEKVYDIFKAIEDAAQENGFISHPDVYESKMVFFNESDDED
jgi:hypothetical protein